MKKKSLGEIYFNAKKMALRKNGLACSDWADLCPEAQAEIQAGCNAVARELRKRDDAKYEKIRQQSRANAVTVAGN